MNRYVGIRIPQKDYEKLKKLATQDKRSTSNLIAIIVREYLKKCSS